MEDIACQADLSKRTRHVHFASEEAGVVSSVDRIVDRHTRLLREVAKAVGLLDE